MYVDPYGCSLIALFVFLAITAIIGGAISAKKAVDEGKEGWELVKSVFIGASIGFAAGGALLAVGGVLIGAVFGASTVVLGVTAAQMFAIGAVAFNISAFVFGPLLGFEMDGIDFEKKEPIYEPPVFTPLTPHPSLKNRRKNDKIFRYYFGRMQKFYFAV